MSYRLEKINHLIRNEISDLLQRHVKDPRLGNFIAITEVRTSMDLKYARVFVSFLGSEAEKKEAMAALDHAKGFFRHELGENLHMRCTPEVSFHWDDSIERGSRLLSLMDQVDKEATAPTTPPPATKRGRKTAA